LIFYSDWCFACIRAAPTFKKVIDSFETVGVVFATVNAGHEHHLVRKTSIHSLPSVLLVLDEHTYMFKESGFSLQKIADFIRQKLPYKLILPITDDSLDSFLNGWHDNRVRGIFFEARQQPRLRYLLTAYYFKNHVHFGFVQTLKHDSKEIIERYKINAHMDTLLLFNEDSQRPIASVSMSDISLDTLNNIIKGNQYLALPRLSSQSMMEGICPMEWHRSKKRLCVILITENSRNHDYARQVVRRIAIESSSYNERVKFAYMYKEKQHDFIHSLSIHNQHDEADKALKIVVIWRRDSRHVKYEWITDATLEETTSVEVDEENYNQTKRKIEERIQKLLKSTEALAYEAEVLVSIQFHVFHFPGCFEHARQPCQRV
jgi:DnaJ family protein C protein 16